LQAKGLLPDRTLESFDRSTEGAIPQALGRPIRICSELILIPLEESFRSKDRVEKIFYSVFFVFKNNWRGGDSNKNIK